MSSVSPTIGSPPPARAAAPTVAACQHCNVALVAADVRRPGGVNSLLGALLILAGLVGFVYELLTALVLLGLGILLVAIGNQQTVMLCPQCGCEATPARRPWRSLAIAVVLAPLLVAIVILLKLFVAGYWHWR